jgi:ribosomal protein L11 methyltransferase
MKFPSIRLNSWEEDHIAPGQELFIYYLKGRLELGHQKFQNNFLGNWEEEDDSILFFSSSADRQIENLLNRQPNIEFVDRYCMSYEKWLGEEFGTLEQGPFRIVPHWEASDVRMKAAVDKRLIILDPGLVFGTGTHPTTRDCLKAIELAVESTNIESVLDLGTGTGLLALAAARLDCKRIIGVDLNLLAAKTAVKNVQLNRLQNRIVIVQGRAEDMIACPSDLLIANLHYDVMHHLVANAGFLAKKRFILSGLLRGEAKHIATLLQRLPIKTIKQWTQDGIWHTIYGKVEL